MTNAQRRVRDCSRLREDGVCSQLNLDAHSAAGLYYFASTTMPPRKQPTTNTTTAKAKVATTTRTRPTRATTDKTDELTATLATKLTISNPKGRQRPTETTTQRATSSRLRKEKATDGGSASDVTQLAQNLAIGLSLGSQLKERTREELCTDAMREVNSASRGLSSIVESGWKRSTSSPTPAQRGAKSNQPDRESQASDYAVSARSALQMLRELKPGDMDVERAASSLVGKLVASEMVREAHSYYLNDFINDSVSIMLPWKYCQKLILLWRNYTVAAPPIHNQLRHLRCLCLYLHRTLHTKTTYHLPSSQTIYYMPLLPSHITCSLA